MKKLNFFLTLTYLLFTINSNADNQNINEKTIENSKILKVGVLLPLSGKYSELGDSFLKSIQLALYDISNKNIKIYPKDSRANALGAYLAAKEFEELGIKIVIGPIFYESLERFNEIDNITFISLTNKTYDLPKNTISFGININSQINTIQKYFEREKIAKTLLLSPKSKFINQTKAIKESDLNFFKTFEYDISPKKITNEIENITKYKERKKDLERRIKILEKSKLPRDENELKLLEQRHTLGKVNFDSVVLVDFDERLKSVLTSFKFSDVSSNDVHFFTLNQWFDKTFFNEDALQKLYFPAINLNNMEKFNNKFVKTFNQKPSMVSILAYDALGLIYYCWSSNNFQFKANQLYNKEGFKGLHGEFIIKDNLSIQKLNIYQVSEKKFIKVF